MLETVVLKNVSTSNFINIYFKTYATQMQLTLISGKQYVNEASAPFKSFGATYGAIAI